MNDGILIQSDCVLNFDVAYFLFFSRLGSLFFKFSMLGRGFGDQHDHMKTTWVKFCLKMTMAVMVVNGRFLQQFYSIIKTFLVTKNLKYS